MMHEHARYLHPFRADYHKYSVHLFHFSKDRGEFVKLLVRHVMDDLHSLPPHNLNILAVDAGGLRNGAAGMESNPQPRRYRRRALPIELQRLKA